jgi:mycothiol synthase
MKRKGFIMSITSIKEQSTQIPWILEYSGLSFRSFNGPEDYPGMVEVIRRCMEADQVKRAITEEDLDTFFKHLNHCDPYEDMLLVEKDGELVAYLRLEWQELSQGQRVYKHIMNIAPEVREIELGIALLNYAESHLEQIAYEHPEDSPKFFEMSVNENEIDKQDILESAGYKPDRYFFSMVRDLTPPLPKASMPDGLQIRPVPQDGYRKVWDALGEAFRDHWGHREQTEEDYQGWINSRLFQPELWKVAWDKEQVVGTVLNFIDEVENMTFKRQRGYTEDICVRRPWRRRGVARSLLVESMAELRKLGMRESALGVDTQNPNGALRLYLGVGYHRERCSIIYRKPF